MILFVKLSHVNSGLKQKKLERFEQTDTAETKQSWVTLREQEQKHTKNRELLINMKNKLKGIEEGPKVEIHLASLKGKHQEFFANYRARGSDGFCFKRFKSTKKRKTTQLCKGLPEGKRKQMDDEMKNYLRPKHHKKEPPP